MKVQLLAQLLKLVYAPEASYNSVGDPRRTAGVALIAAVVAESSVVAAAAMQLETRMKPKAPHVPPTRILWVFFGGT